MKMKESGAPRRGYALIEVVLAVGAVAIVLGLCAGLLHVLLRLDRTGRSHLVKTATIGRLSRQFRQDVHAAWQAKAVGAAAAPAAKLELVLRYGGTIDYEVGARTISRSEHQGGTVTRRETFALPVSREAEFQVIEDDGQVWVRLRLRLGPENVRATDPESPRQDQELPIEALVGKDRDRFLVIRDAQPVSVSEPKEGQP